VIHGYSLSWVTVQAIIFVVCGSLWILMNLLVPKFKKIVL
jgi:hypothetical protein